MRNLTCPRCGVEFTTNHPTKKYCSRTCARRACGCAKCKKAHRDYMREYRANQAPRDFSNRTHGLAKTYSAGCRCDDCRLAWREYRQERRARIIAEGFAGRKHGTVSTYSSGCRCDECRSAYKQYRHAYQNAKGFPTRADNLKKVRICDVCGVEFRSPYGVVRYCTRECAEKAPNRGRWISRKDRRAILERDGYICYICGEKVNRVWSPDELGKNATLDHVIPRDKGGTDDPSNLRTCCQSCNSVKGTHIYRPVQHVLFDLGGAS